MFGLPYGRSFAPPLRSPRRYYGRGTAAATANGVFSSPNPVDVFFSSLESKGFVWSKDALNVVFAEAGLP
jgi:hypothetical protein